jgi:hypothetical protein
VGIITSDSDLFSVWEGVMQFSAIIDRVHHALKQFGTHCSMEEVVGLCPDLTWNQVHLSIDYLSKTGKVRVTLDPDRTYTVHPVLGEPSQVSSIGHIQSTVQ